MSNNELKYCDVEGDLLGDCYTKYGPKYFHINCFRFHQAKIESDYIQAQLNPKVPKQTKKEILDDLFG